MADWTRGYRIDQGYTFGAYRELFPDWLDMAVTLAGLVPPSEHVPRPRYLELGCGQGFGLCLAAACNPHIEFVGVDFGPGHVVHARRLARAAALDNVSFVEADVLDLAERGRDGLGAFDYVVLHGLYTWVARPVREAIVRLLDAVVAPGGLALVSYNSQPGWAPMLPFQHIAQSIARAFPQPGPKVVDATIALFDQMRDAEADMFGAMPVLVERLQAVKQNDRDYLVQEYLHDGWEPLWSSQVARDLGGAKLDYAASATLMENLLPQALPEKIRSVVISMPDSAVRRDLIDCAIMQPFRRDIFMRGRIERLKNESGADDLVVTRMKDHDQPSLTVGTTFAQFDLPAAVFRPLLDTLAGGPRTMGELEAHPALASQTPSARAQSVLLLVAAGLASMGPARSRPVEPARRLNAVIAGEVAKGAQYNYVAAPAAGLPLNAQLHHLLALGMLMKDSNAQPGAIKAGVTQRLQALGKGIERDGKLVTGAAAETIVDDMVAGLLDDDVPRWRALGMIE